MLRLFQTIQPTALFFLILYTGLLQYGNFVSLPMLQDTAQTPISLQLFEWLDNIFLNAPKLYLSLGISFCLVQALILNKLANESKWLSQQGYLPAMTFILYVSLFPGFSAMSAVMIANLFHLLILRQLVMIYKKTLIYIDAFDIGLLIALASLFYLPSLAMVLFFFIGISLVRPFHLKEWIMGLMGLAVPYFLLSTYLFWNDTLGSFLSLHFAPLITLGTYALQLSTEMVVKVSLFVLLLIWAIILVQANFLRSSVQHRKFTGLLIWLLIIGTFSFILQDELTLNHFVLASLPTSMLIAYLLNETRYRGLAETVHIIIIGIIFFYQTLLIA